MNDEENLLVAFLGADLTVAFDPAEFRFYGAWSGAIAWTEGRAPDPEADALVNSEREVGPGAGPSARPRPHGGVEDGRQNLWWDPLTWASWRFESEAGKQGELTVRDPRFRVERGRLCLHYELVAPTGAFVQMVESPEVVRHPNGQPGLERRFEVRGLPAGARLRLASNQVYVAADRNQVRVTGPARFQRAREISAHFERDYELAIDANGSVSVRVFYAPPLEDGDVPVLDRYPWSSKPGTPEPELEPEQEQGEQGAKDR